MYEPDPNILTEAECFAEFDQLFPHGFGGPDVCAELAPTGWEDSPLRAIFHPSLDQLYEESLRLHRNLLSLRRPDDANPLPPEPTREEVQQGYQPRPSETDREVRDLVGQCLWDLFSDNHDVLAPDGRVVDIGSFRGAGGFLADCLNRQVGREQYDYMDFYMGTCWVSQRADLTPVYEMIFRRLRGRRCDWRYSFPKLHLVDLRPLREALKPKDEPDWLNYSPSEALAQEAQDRERDRELAEMRDSLEEDHRAAVEEAAQGPPPKSVAAYRSIYRRWPAGWPPTP